MQESKSKKLLVYDVLKERIITQVMKPGEPINEGVLSQELEISKTPIREAIQQLEKEGFIENIPGKGNFVSYISIQGLRELFEIREMLECEAIKRAAVKRDPQKLTEIRKAFELSGESVAGRLTATVSCGRAHSHFHLRVARQSAVAGDLPPAARSHRQTSELFFQRRA